MGARFKMSGGACCCCNDIYLGVGGDYFRVDNPSKSNWLNEGERFFYNTAIASTTFDIDHNTKRIYYGRSQSSSPYARVRWRSHDTSLTAENQIFESTTMRMMALCVDWRNERLFLMLYSNASLSDVEIHSIRFDGSDDTTIYTTTIVGSVGRTAVCHYEPNNNRLYFSEGFQTGGDAGAWAIKYCNADDGSGVTTIHTQTARPIFETYLASLEVKTTDGGRLFWVEEDASVAPRTMRFMSSNLSGGDQVTVRSNTTFQFNANNIQYSHKEDKLYLTEKEISTSGPFNLFRCDTDGGNLETLIDRRQLKNGNVWFGASATGFMRLGCGFETTGPGTKA